jgi:hypothetical protein
MTGPPCSRGSLEPDTVKCGLSPVVLGPENECAGEGQQQLQTTDPSSHQRGCYIRTTTASVQLKKKKNLAVSLNGLGAKMN